MENNHLIHDIFIFIPIVLAIALILKDKLLKLSKLQAIVIIVLVLFTAIHLNPDKLTFAYHHQSTDSQSQHHPCCMPQVSNTAVSFEIPVIITFAKEKENNPEVFHPLLSTNSINNRSPPSHS